MIMPVYNSEKTVQRAISSVQRQTDESWEILAVDDASTDGSWEILSSLASVDGRIKTIHQEINCGAGVARNLAIEQAQGRFIAFLDADDEWHIEKLEKQIGWMINNNISFSCTDYARVHINGRRVIASSKHRATRKQLLRNNSVGTLTAVYDTKQFGKVFMPNIRRRQDYALWLSLLEKAPYVFGLNEVLATYNMGVASLSSNKINAASDQWSLYRNHLDFGRIKSLYFFLLYIYFGTKKNL